MPTPFEPSSSLAASVLARVVKLGVSPPTPYAVRALFLPLGREALREAAAALEDPLVVEAGRGLAELAEPSLPELERLYAEIFGHTLRGRVCPYETEYGADAPFRQAQELADLQGYYGAFGLTPALRDRVDHIGCELDFLEFLCMKEVYAAEQGDDEMLEVTRDAARGFMRDHLGRFGLAFGASLAEEAGEGFYRSLAKLGTAFLAAECRRRGIEPGPELLPLTSTAPDGIPMACGGDSEAPELVQIEEEAPR